MKKNKKIIIIGASYLQCPLIEKAREMDLETHVFAWEKGAVAKDIADYFYPVSIIKKEKILKIAQEINPNAICSIASDLAIPTINFIADKLNLVANSIESTKKTTNKYHMRKSLIKENIKCPKFLRIKNNDIHGIPDINYPLIVKPTDRSGSRGVTKVNSSGKLKEAIKYADNLSFSSEVIIEEFIEGDEISVETISFNKKHYYLTSTDKETTGEPNYVEVAHHQPSIYSIKLKKKILDITFKCLDCLEITNGAAHTELKITPEGDIYVIEIAQRMGGDFIGSNLVELSTGYDFLKGVLEVSLGNFVEPVLTENFFSGVYFLVPKKTGKVQEIIDKTANYKSLIIKKDIDLMEGNFVKLATNSSERKGYYIYKSRYQKLENKNLLSVKVIPTIMKETSVNI